MRLWNNVFRPDVATDADLREYVISVTLLAWIVAEFANMVQQMLSFVSWTRLCAELALSTVVVLVIAIPVARTMGRAHLELHRARNVAERLSRTDSMTGLANRRAFYEAASQLGDGVLALIVADIDRFKRINDRYGHAVGDDVIKNVASHLQEELGDLGVVARLGGEEFALVGSNVSAAALQLRLLKFRQRLADAPVRFDGIPISTTLSIGFVSRRDFSFDALYAAADKALYVAKTGGRDCVVDFDEITDVPPLTALLAG